MRTGGAGFEERWTGGYIFENEWQSFRTRQCRDLELTTVEHTYQRRGRYTVASSERHDDAGAGERRVRIGPTK